ncbi:hypothetical protein CEXT_66571 [Caerostris extrusa]|uniref:Uncharacterized protein n=1 Tax=Caerostris extrusa TaxID=172846 RepID=A0AAV4XRV4_CAEEX|nr:hypothetical protein CEXT_66571 [Caerostris extrusa]
MIMKPGLKRPGIGKKTCYAHFSFSSVKDEGIIMKYIEGYTQPSNSSNSNYHSFNPFHSLQRRTAISFSPHPTHTHPLPDNKYLSTHFSAPLREAARYANPPSLGSMHGMAGKRSKNIAGIKAASEMAPGALTQYLAEYPEWMVVDFKRKNCDPVAIFSGLYLFLMSSWELKSLIIKVLLPMKIRWLTSWGVVPQRGGLNFGRSFLQF